jgi:RNA polymerase sigma factor (sigma-70 family)
MTYYARLMAEDNQDQLDQLKRNLATALREDLTPRQRQELGLYYDRGMTMGEIACRLDIDRSTVSRTLKRGEQRLRRCLRYGGAGLLQRPLPEEPTTGKRTRRPKV